MKAIQALIIALCALAYGCQNYDDSALWDELEAHTERITALEAMCQKMNSNISALEDIVDALQANDYVTDISPLATEDGTSLGYKISFSKSGTITIYHGKDGVNGAPGQDGLPGQDGVDGKDGHTPVIGVRKDSDGNYYWTLDGEWLKDSEGNKIPTTGKDGADGQPGEDGKPGTPGQDGEDGADGEQGKPGQDGADGITPLLKIEDDYWYISYDNGKTWQQLYKAVGEDGAAGANGTDGAPGKDGQSFFQSVDTTNPNYIILILADGSQIKIPTWKAFEELQTKVNQMNTNLSALQVILEALEAKDYVTEITTATDNGQEVGYTIYFSKSQPVTIYHGKDGQDGVPGQDGAPGQDGEDGKDGHTPVIGIKKATEEDWTLDSGWIGDPATDYYWTLDGEWLLDAEGNRIPATGQHGTTPLLKIEDGLWYISTDGGKTWQAASPATGGDNCNIFTDISYDSGYLYITLNNGDVLTLSYHEFTLRNLSDISIEPYDTYAVFTGHIDIPAEDMDFCQASIYYAYEEEDNFNIHTAKSSTTTKFDYNKNFLINLKGLEPNSRYKYIIGIKVRGEEFYTNTQVFETTKPQLHNLYSPVLYPVFQCAYSSCAYPMADHTNVLIHCINIAKGRGYGINVYQFPVKAGLTYSIKLYNAPTTVYTEGYDSDSDGIIDIEGREIPYFAICDLYFDETIDGLPSYRYSYGLIGIHNTGFYHWTTSVQGNYTGDIPIREETDLSHFAINKTYNSDKIIITNLTTGDRNIDNTSSILGGAHTNHDKYHTQAIKVQILDESITHMTIVIGNPSDNYYQLGRDRKGQTGILSEEDRIKAHKIVENGLVIVEGDILPENYIGYSE